mmetsp:Transcript_164753/g.528581  ORF Transcript_164753/g.528581 Transcript_164753/m.528581 type:complete len:334 (-) Transcript_164753:1669-2670(-)
MTEPPRKRTDFFYLLTFRYPLWTTWNTHYFHTQLPWTASRRNSPIQSCSPMRRTQRCIPILLKSLFLTPQHQLLSHCQPTLPFPMRPSLLSSRYMPTPHSPMRRRRISSRWRIPHSLMRPSRPLHIRRLSQPSPTRPSWLSCHRRPGGWLTLHAMMWPSRLTLRPRNLAKPHFPTHQLPRAPSQTRPRQPCTYLLRSWRSWARSTQPRSRLSQRLLSQTNLPRCLLLPPRRPSQGRYPLHSTTRPSTPPPHRFCCLASWADRLPSRTGAPRATKARAMRAWAQELSFRPFRRPSRKHFSLRTREQRRAARAAAAPPPCTWPWTRMRTACLRPP